MTVIKHIETSVIETISRVSAAVTKKVTHHQMEN